MGRLEELSMEHMVQDHEKRILQLEKQSEETRNKLQAVETGQYRIEKVILEQGIEQGKLLNKLIDNQFDLKKMNVLTREKIWVKALGVLGGAGGLFAFIVALIKLFY
jgi:hypothetical protein